MIKNRPDKITKVQTKPNGYFSQQEVASKLNVKPCVISRKTKELNIQPIKCGRHPYYCQADIDKIKLATIPNKKHLSTSDIGYIASCHKDNINRITRENGVPPSAIYNNTYYYTAEKSLIILKELDSFKDDSDESITKRIQLFLGSDICNQHQRIGKGNLEQKCVKLGIDIKTFFELKDLGELTPLMKDKGLLC